MQLRKDYLKLKPMWRLEDGNRKVRKWPFLKPSENSNLTDWNCTKRLNGQTRLKEKRSIYVENWKWEMDASGWVAQELAKKLSNHEEFVAKKQIEPDTRELMNCLCNRRGILLLLTQMQDPQNRVNSLSDAREFRDPETARSSGASHVPSQLLTISSPRGMPSRDSDCRLIHGILLVRQETFSKAYLLEKDHPQLSSRIHRIWHHLLADLDRVLQEIWRNMEEVWDESRNVRQYQPHVLNRVLQP